MARTSILQRLGTNVQQYRKQAGLTQVQLGSATGLDRGYISGVERAARNPSIKTLEKIAKVLKVKVSDLTVGL
ncbi:MAG TPA: helix-turn-helix transcriptional regulator [Candidatus Saccharimonadales bacterium]|jgi:transcriptional regulator with XRE-family HTH domain|nr:helix-turn-helix transcriptional regulator [Candidatus Saccharimonadales bacterium]